MKDRRLPDMPRLVLNVNVHEIEEAAKFGADAIFRMASFRPGKGRILSAMGPDGPAFCAYRTKTSVVVWSQQKALPNPLSSTINRD